MQSNAYIAQGKRDGAPVMKVGKANNIKRRERQIAIPVHFTIACLDEDAALRVESRLRDFVIEQGGIRHPGTIDWFRFDPQIYQMLCEFAQGLDAQEVATGISLDDEIGMYVARYRRLLLDELDRRIVDLKDQIAEVERIRGEEREEFQMQITQLNREIAVLEYRLAEKGGEE